MQQLRGCHPLLHLDLRNCFVSLGPICNTGARPGIRTFELWHPCAVGTGDTPNMDLGSNACTTTPKTVHERFRARRLSNFPLTFAFASLRWTRQAHTQACGPCQRCTNGLQASKQAEPLATTAGTSRDLHQLRRENCKRNTTHSLKTLHLGARICVRARSTRSSGRWQCGHVYRPQTPSTDRGLYGQAHASR